jgi:hypothetical protein
MIQNYVGDGKSATTLCHVHRLQQREGNDTTRYFPGGEVGRWCLQQLAEAPLLSVTVHGFLYGS